jgi:hypothetical protein
MQKAAAINKTCDISLLQHTTLTDGPSTVYSVATYKVFRGNGSCNFPAYSVFSF